MDLVSVDDVKAAALHIAGNVLRTPIVQATWAGDGGGSRSGGQQNELWLKPENLQAIGAFKQRGATNAVSRLDPILREKGVVTHSSGNHGQALAWAAQAYGVPATVVMPDAAATNKIDATKALGAEVVLVPASEREAATSDVVAERGGVFVPPYDDANVIAGQGTVGLEIIEDLPDVQTVLVPVGGGGLISGVAAAVKGLAPNARVIGVEPELAADAAESMRVGTRIAWNINDTTRTIADGVRTTVLGEITWPHISALVDEIVTVSEDEIIDAIGLLARRSRIVAEPSGALATAAYLKSPARMGLTVAVVSGGNVDPRLLSSALARG